MCLKVGDSDTLTYAADGSPLLTANAFEQTRTDELDTQTLTEWNTRVSSQEEMTIDPLVYSAVRRFKMDPVDASTYSITVFTGCAIKLRLLSRKLKENGGTIMPPAETIIGDVDAEANEGTA